MAHRFFSPARWSIRQVSAVLARLVIDQMVPAGQPVLAAVDDTLFKRSGGTVHAASWFHDGSATGRNQVGYGNCADLMVMPTFTRIAWEVRGLRPIRSA